MSALARRLVGVRRGACRRPRRPARAASEPALLAATLLRFSPLALVALPCCRHRASCSACSHLGRARQPAATRPSGGRSLSSSGCSPVLIALGALNRAGRCRRCARCGERRGTGPRRRVALRRTLRAEVSRSRRRARCASASCRRLTRRRAAPAAVPSRRRQASASAASSSPSTRARSGRNEIHLYLFERVTAASSTAPSELRPCTTPAQDGANRPRYGSARVERGSRPLRRCPALAFGGRRATGTRRWSPRASASSTSTDDHVQGSDQVRTTERIDDQRLAVAGRWRPSPAGLPRPRDACNPRAAPAGALHAARRARAERDATTRERSRSTSQLPDGFALRLLRAGCRAGR